MAKKILIIDDEAGFVEMLKMRLGAAGYELISAIDGDEGLEKAKKNMPDLILLDLVMPKANGILTLHKLKSEPATAGIPVIVISAKVDSEYALDAANLGATDYLTKPLKMEDLEIAVRKYL